MFHLLQLLESNQIEEAIAMLKVMISDKRSKAIQVDPQNEEKSIQNVVEVNYIETMTVMMGEDKEMEALVDTCTRSSQKTIDLQDSGTGESKVYQDVCCGLFIDVYDKEIMTMDKLSSDTSTQVILSTTNKESNCLVSTANASCLAEDIRLNNLATSLQNVNIVKDKHPTHSIKAKDASSLHNQEITLDSFSDKLKSIQRHLTIIKSNLPKLPQSGADDQSLFDVITENTSIIGKLETTNNAVRQELHQRSKNTRKKPTTIRRQMLPL